MAYPSSIDAPDVTMQGGSFLATNDHALNHRVLGSAVIATENKLGIGAGSAAANKILVGSGAGTSAWGQTWNGGTLGTATLNNGVVGTPAITGGTGNAMVLGTPTIGTVTVPGTVNALSFSAAIAPGVGTIADSAGGTLTVNAQAGQIFYSAQGTSAGNRTIGTPQNPTPYQLLTYAFKSSGSANGTLIWAPIFRISQDIGTPTIGTGVTWNYYSWRYNAIDTKYDFQGQSKDLI